MNKPPRDPSEAIVEGRHWLRIGLAGAAITAATLLAFALSLFWLELDAGASVTVAFLALATAQLWNVFNVRDPAAGLVRNDVTGNPYVWGAIALCAGLLALALWMPSLAGLLGLPWPGREGIALALGAGVLPLVAGQLWLVAHGRRRRLRDR